jgi:protein phosphatase
MKLTIPELSLVVLVGASGSGKSSFAAKHFLPTEVLSSDECRGLVSDDENDQAATNDAFDVLHYIAGKRLALGRLTVVDATNVQPEARKPLVELARRHHCLPVAIVLDVPEQLCRERNAGRPDRTFGPHVVRRQSQQLRRSLRSLKREGFRTVHVLRSPGDVEAATIERQPLWNNRKDEHGPFDIVGDIHGCYDELVELLENLGWDVTADAAGPSARHPEGRRAIFVGDFVDRGPRIPDTLRLVMRMVADGVALAVPGNHDVKLVRKLNGRDVRITHGLADSLEQLDGESPEFREAARTFLDRLVSHYVLDGGELVVAHAGLKAEMQGRGSGKVRDFALYGETTGETDELGLPVRFDWASEYRGRAMVVYGHTPVPDPEWVNRTINIDTGCVFGHRLTALRYPERELVSVPAHRTYYESPKPFVATPKQVWEARPEALLDINDVLGKRIVSTRLHGNVTVREENAIAAVEVMSRFAADPRWLIHLPPTMSPSETSGRDDALEHPAEAFAYYRHAGVERVVCQEKHMGSRSIVIACRDADVAARRFGVRDARAGVCLTRTGRHFFDDDALEAALVERVAAAAGRAGLWEELATEWLCLDCELMPWSAKAVELLQRQYAPVAAAAGASFPHALAALSAAEARGVDVGDLRSRYQDRSDLAARYGDAYRRYCWPVAAIDDLRLAPFHVLASDGAVHADRDHLWHMQTVARLCEERSPLLHPTNHVVVDLADPRSEQDATRWWDELTARGGEGMVVKPLEFVARGPRGLVQPAVKCRGRDYLRIIYGPEYDAPGNLERLRARGLGAKRSLALREFALGIEALERFVRGEPLYRVHECVFAVLALESEPVDPAL